MPELPPLDLQNALTVWRFDGLAASLTVIAGSAYLWGVVTLRRRGQTWRHVRTTAFMAGLAVVVAATQSAIGAYDTTLFWAHSLQHLLLGIVAPLLLVLGRPVTLAMQAGSRPAQTGLVRVVRSAPARVVTHPVVAWLLFATSMFVVYLTGMYELSLRHPLAHQAVHLHMVAVGCLFFVVFLAAAPIPRAVGYPVRILGVVLLVPVHAVLGLAIMYADPPIGVEFYTELGRRWGPAPEADQLLGGGILWAAGELLFLVVLLALVGGWMDSEERKGRRLDRSLAASHPPHRV